MTNDEWRNEVLDFRFWISDFRFWIVNHRVPASPPPRVSPSPAPLLLFSPSPHLPSVSPSPPPPIGLTAAAGRRSLLRFGASRRCRARQVPNRGTPPRRPAS